MGRIKYNTIKNPSSMRKLALGAWKKPSDPSVFVQIELNISKLDIESKYFKPLFIKLISKVLHECPELNRILIRNKFRKRKDNRIFIPTLLKNKRNLDLSGITINNAYTYHINELKEIWDIEITKLRSNQNKPINRSRFIYQMMPNILVKPITKLISFLHYTLNIPLSIVGLPDDPFGAITVTFLDKFNIKYAHVPIYGFSRSGVLLSMGMPFKENNKRIVPITCTFDHRYFDGYEALKAYKKLIYYCNNPNLI